MVNLRNPTASIRSHTRDIIFGIVLLLGVIIASVTVGRAIGENEIANWGTWIGAFIAGIAMVASAYALILQSRQAESASWAIALSRLGQLYDQAYQDDNLAKILVEKPDADNHLAPYHHSNELTIRQTIWMGSLGLAFEQIYVATNSLSSEAKRVWRLYLKNQLNKPTIRSAFVADASSAQDYHQDFWRFIRGRQTQFLGNIEYLDYAIHPKYFGVLKGEERFSDVTALHAKSTSRSDMAFWLEMYRDEEVSRQMYAAPTDSEKLLWDYLAPRNVFTVWRETERIGGFTLSPEKDLLATFGVVIHPKYRNQRLGESLMSLVFQESKKLGIKTLRADIYDDNKPCIYLMNNCGFRKFIWMEKNI